MQPIRVVNPEPEPWLAYLMVGLCIVFGGWIFYEWNRNWTRLMPGTDGWAPNAAIAAQTVSLMQATAAFRPIGDVLIVKYAHNKPGLVGRRVQLDEVGVRAVSGEGAFWVSQLGTQPVFVVPQPSAGRVRFAQSVNLTGTLRMAPPRVQIRAKWPRLTDQQLAQLDSDRLYIEADHVEPVGWY